jgi:GNAT superfamily N-acetyltransferase
VTLSDGYEMRTATDADVPTIVAMRDAVGWRAHPWAVRAVLRAPRGRLLCVTLGESVVAVGSGVAYGALGVVGNMIVAAEHRRRGLGSAILRAVMRFLLDEAGCRRLELYATPEGRPLYIRHGFGFIEPAAHAPLPIVTPPADGTRVEIASAEDTGALAAYDAPRFGGDRSSLIEGMAADVERPLLMARRDGALAGYAWLRPDDARLGPFVADDPSAAEAIVAEAQRHVDDPAGLSTNIPTTNGPGVAWLESLGAELDPWDGRMARGPAVPRRDETIYGSVVGALG